MNEYGTELCNKLDIELSGTEEWDRRIKQKISDRTRAIEEIVKLIIKSRSDSGRELRNSPHTRGLNVIALAHQLLHKTMDAGNARWAKLLETMGNNELLDDERIEDTRTLLDDVSAWALRGAGDSQVHYGSLIGSAAVCLFEFSRPEVSRTLYFGCEPAWKACQTRRSDDVVDFEKFLGGVSGRTKIFVFQPELKNLDLAALALKARFFESILDDERRKERGHEQPLVAYVADEFHRFVTSDKVHGEQSFLDTCRSYGVFCVLASQSISAISYALQQLEEDRAVVESAISILSNNTGNKLFFRTTDKETMQWAGSLAPAMPGGGQNVVTLRPLSSLQPGECLAVLVNGLVKRAQLDEWLRRPKK